MKKNLNHETGGTIYSGDIAASCYGILQVGIHDICSHHRFLSYIGVKVVENTHPHI